MTDLDPAGLLILIGSLTTLLIAGIAMIFEPGAPSYVVGWGIFIVVTTGIIGIIIGVFLAAIEFRDVL